jgi:DNA-binding NarL/FixJ family response regulator
MVGSEERRKNQVIPGQAQRVEMEEISPDRLRVFQPPHWSLLSGEPVQTAGSGRAAARGRSAAPGGIAVIAFIDKYSFTRECISVSLQAGSADFRFVSHASCAGALSSDTRYDLFLFHCHDEDGEFGSSELAAADFKAMAALGPVVVLGAIERFEFIFKTFENGARGYIPIGSTPPGLVIEILRLVRAGGTFVPLSGLPSRDARARGDLVGADAGRRLTSREKAILKLLECGKANKIIAHELHLSESTVKAYIRNVMKKMKASNRTEAVCQAYAMKLLGIGFCWIAAKSVLGVLGAAWLIQAGLSSRWP